MIRQQVVTVCVAFLVIIGLCSDVSAAKLVIKAFILNEVEACRPAGYTKDDEPTNCQPWSADEAEAAYDSAQYKSESDVPPGGKILLGNLLPIVRSYTQFNCSVDAPCNDPSVRQTIVMLFEWDAPQTGKIVFKRIGVGRVPGRTVTGILHHEMRWVDHQRADVFLPVLGTRWLLTINRSLAFVAE